MENKIKTIIEILLVGIMLFPIISAITPENVVWKLNDRNFTEIDFTIDEMNYTSTFRTEEIFEEYRIEDGFSENLTYTEYVNQTFYNYLENKFGEKVLQNSTFDVVQAHDYQYASDGWREDYTPQQLRDALMNMQVGADGEINKSSYPAPLVTEDGERLHLGKTQSFIIALLQMVNEFIDRIINNENRLDEIEGDLCNQGYNKYC